MRGGLTRWLGLGLVWGLTGLTEVHLGTLLEWLAGLLCGTELGIGPGPGRCLRFSLSLSVGGKGVSAAGTAGKDPRLGRNGSLSAGEEARIAKARLLGVRLGEAGNPGPCKIASVNVTSLRRVVPAILKLDWDVMCVQESNIDVRSDDYKGLMGELRDHRVALYRGVLEEGKCKVAFLVEKGSFRPEGHLKVGPVSRSLCGTWHGGGDASVQLACLY